MTAGRRGAHYWGSGIGQNRLNISSQNHFAFKLSIYVPSSLFEQKRMFLIPTASSAVLNSLLIQKVTFQHRNVLRMKSPIKGQLRRFSMSSLWLLNSSREINMPSENCGQSLAEDMRLRVRFILAETPVLKASLGFTHRLKGLSKNGNAEPNPWDSCLGRVNSRCRYIPLRQVRCQEDARFFSGQHHERLRYR